MSWTTPADIRAQVQRLWDRGVIAASIVDGSEVFPRRLLLKGPTSHDLSERFQDVRTWIAGLMQLSHCRVVMREVRHRVIGTNAIPEEIWIDSLDHALLLIGKRVPAQQLRALATETQARQPPLHAWLQRNALQSLRLADDWTRLLDVVEWLKARPRPGVYLREVDLAGIHSKFIEGHRAVLSDWLDLVLSGAAIDTKAVGSSQFCARYGFREKPLRIRFRVLDPALRLVGDGCDQDLTLNAEAFKELNPGISRVFITENETNFLAFPEVSSSLVIFGAGYGFEMLAEAAWLAECDIHYWGDIDTHGFAILDQLRAVLLHARSMLMDRMTLMQHQTLWGTEPKPERRDLFRLTREERELYDDLRDNRLGERIRLEQERVRFGYLEAALTEIAGRP